MERQSHVCVIDWFGVNYDGTMPTIHGSGAEDKFPGFSRRL